MRKKFQNYVMHFIVLINPEIKRTGGSAWDYILQKILEQHQFPYCIENTEKGIKVEINDVMNQPEGCCDGKSQQPIFIHIKYIKKRENHTFNFYNIKKKYVMEDFL